MILSPGPTDIIEHNLKLILGLVWSLILRYQIASAPAPPPDSEQGQKQTKETEKKKATKRTNAKKLLLGWVTATLPDQGISNLTTDWNDGTNLAALVDNCRPGLIPNHDSLDPNKRLENVTNAMNLAQDNFGIPQVMHPEDLAVDKPDELSVMTYLSYFCRPDSIGQQVVLDWIQKQIPHKGVTNFTTDWVDGRSLGALTDVVSGGNFPEKEQMVPQRGLENCRESMNAAESLLGVKKIVSPEEFTSPDLDQLTRMSYLTQFRPSKSSSAAPKLEVCGDFPGKGTNLSHSTPSECTATGDGLHKAQISNTAMFCVNCASGGQGELQVEIEGPTGNVVTEITKKKDRVYFTPLESGLHSIAVKWNGKHVPESPFTCLVMDPRCTATGPGLTGAKVGEPGHFTVNTDKCHLIPPNAEAFFLAEPPVRVMKPGQSIGFCLDISAAGNGQFTANCMGSRVGEVPITISERHPDKHDVKFTPVESDIYNIDVLWSGKHVKGSPFQINLILRDGESTHPFEVAFQTAVETGVSNITKTSTSEDIDVAMENTKLD